MSVTSPTMRLPRSVGPGMRTLGRYIAKLASGGMATVYLGRLGGAGGFERVDGYDDLEFGPAQLEVIPPT